MQEKIISPFGGPAKTKRPIYIGRFFPLRNEL